MPRRCRRPMPPQPTAAYLILGAMLPPKAVWDPRGEGHYSASRWGGHLRLAGGVSAWEIVVNRCKRWEIVVKTCTNRSGIDLMMVPDQEGTGPEIGFVLLNAHFWRFS